MESEKKPGKPDRGDKSYLSVAVESISPWATSRSSTPQPASAGLPGEGSGFKSQQGGDHTFNHWHNFIHRRSYPPDCPSLTPRWFYAVDIPKRKPKLLKTKSEDNKPKPSPKKFAEFSISDSRAIETAYQKLSDEYDTQRGQHNRFDVNSQVHAQSGDLKNVTPAGNTSIEEAGRSEHAGGKVRVAVHEDYLFDVDLEHRELCPAYWLGPIYEVRRGSWFYHEGSSLRPCEENLAAQLEEGYLKVKPFRYGKGKEKQSSLAASGAFSNRSRNHSDPVSLEGSPRVSGEEIRITNLPPSDGGGAGTAGSKDSSMPAPHQPETYRLFGAYMNSIVTYQDSTVAWLSVDSIMSRVSSTVYQKFAGGGYMGGVRLVRGYSDPGKTKEHTLSDDRPRTPTSAVFTGTMPGSLQVDERQQKLLKRRSAPPSTVSGGKPIFNTNEMEDTDTSEASARDPEEEVARKLEEKEMQSDYNNGEDDQSREVDHLILVTHGIGQRLGMRTESVNFVHDINVLRQTIKSVYNGSADLQALNNEIENLPKNCRVQVLPVCWRHLLDFPRQGVRQNRKEHDLGDTFLDDEEYPSLEDITVDGVPFVRSLITDLALDILLYQSAYREHISSIVLAESNRIYNLFCERNPGFLSRGGKVSLVGHSLGSAILFDILCRQRETPIQEDQTRHHRNAHNFRPRPIKSQKTDKSFEFQVPSFFCLGSPIGLFQMLKGRTIAARHQSENAPVESPQSPDFMGDPFNSSTRGISSTTGLPVTISSPKCAQLYNIFYPTDPISYRLEPLISAVYGSMKPQPLPYTKTNFGTTASQGLTGIGAKVGQSVSGLWSSLSSGIASSLLNRSLGLTQADIASMGGPTHVSSPQSVGAGTNISSGGVVSEIPILARANTNEKKMKLVEDTAASDRDGKDNAPTLIDNEIETLYTGFQNSRKEPRGSTQGSEQDRVEVEERGKRLRREDMKLRALNHTGRVDFQIQESVLDFNPMSTITSHLSYWADEDVAHFMLSQLLSRNRSTRPEQVGRKKARNKQ